MTSPERGITARDDGMAEQHFVKQGKWLGDEVESMGRDLVNVGCTAGSRTKLWA